MIGENKNTIAKEKNIFSFLIALMVFSHVYLVPFATSISFGELSVLLFGFCSIFFINKFNIYRSNLLSIFFIFSIIISISMPLMYGTSLEDPFTRLLRDTSYWLIITFLGYNLLDYIVFSHWVRIFCVALSIMIIVQELFFVMTGNLIPGFFLNATVSQSASAMEIYQHTAMRANYLGYLKANGFLTEGAHAAQALAIASVLSIDFENAISKKNIYTLILFSVASIMTFSASGMAYVTFVWVLFMFLSSNNKRALVRKALMVIVFLIVLLFLAFGLKDKFDFLSVFNRLINAGTTDTNDGSTFLRLYKGLEFWNGLPWDNKLFGIGFGNFMNLKFLYSGTNLGALNQEYMNSLSYIIVSCGIVGFLVFSCFIIKLFLESNKKGKSMIVLLVIMSATASPYSSPFWVWMLLVIIFNKKEKKCE